MIAATKPVPTIDVREPDRAVSDEAIKTVARFLLGIVKGQDQATGEGTG